MIYEREGWWYNGETGELITPRGDRPVFYLMDKTRKTSYWRRHASFQSRSTSTSRIIWWIVHGEMPTGFIDHIDGDTTNERLGNLAVVTNRENLQKRRNASPHGVGVFFNRRKDKYGSQIHVNGHHLFGPYRATAAEARTDYLDLLAAHLSGIDICPLDVRKSLLPSWGGARAAPAEVLMPTPPTTTAIATAMRAVPPSKAVLTPPPQVSP